MDLRKNNTSIFSFIGRVESEQRHMDDGRQNGSKLSTIDKQDERILAEAKQDKLRYLEEVHSAQRKMNDLQAHLKVLESKLADKDVEIRLLQEKKSNSHLQRLLNFLIDKSPIPFLELASVYQKFDALCIVRFNLK